MRDPAYRYTIFAILVLVAVSISAVPLIALGAPPAVILALPLVSGLVVGVSMTVALRRTKPVAELLPRYVESSEAARARFDERVTSVLAHEWLMTFQALRVAVTDAELIVAWDGRFSQKLVRGAPPSLGASTPGLGFRVPLATISKAKRRQLLLPHFLWELLRPHQGLGVLGEWKYRIRGVRTGVAIQTSQGLRAWIATRRPDDLLSALSSTGER